MLQEVGANSLLMSRLGYMESQLISLSEEMMWPQLMCCALSIPSLSQFHAEVGMHGDNCPEGQDSVYSGLWRRLQLSGFIWRIKLIRLLEEPGFRVGMRSG